MNWTICFVVPKTETRKTNDYQVINDMKRNLKFLCTWGTIYGGVMYLNLTFTFSVVYQTFLKIQIWNYVRLNGTLRLRSSLPKTYNIIFRFLQCRTWIVLDLKSGRCQKYKRSPKSDSCPFVQCLDESWFRNGVLPKIFSKILDHFLLIGAESYY